VTVADTSAVVALIDADDPHHAPILALFEEDPESWVFPWAILPEVDYIVLSQLGEAVEMAFVADLASGAFVVGWGEAADIRRANDLCSTYRDLELGLTDAVVMAMAERLGASAIATLDLRDFGAVTLRGTPRLVPRDA
jgi:predicted nucleic acid-binding protein